MKTNIFENDILKSVWIFENCIFKIIKQPMVLLKDYILAVAHIPPFLRRILRPCPPYRIELANWCRFECPSWPHLAVWLLLAADEAVHCPFGSFALEIRFVGAIVCMIWFRFYQSFGLVHRFLVGDVGHLEVEWFCKLHSISYSSTTTPYSQLARHGYSSPVLQIQAALVWFLVFVLESASSWVSSRRLWLWPIAGSLVHFCLCWRFWRNSFLFCLNLAVKCRMPARWVHLFWQGAWRALTMCSNHVAATYQSSNLAHSCQFPHLDWFLYKPNGSYEDPSIC